MWAKSLEGSTKYWNSFTESIFSFGSNFFAVSSEKLKVFSEVWQNRFWKQYLIKLLTYGVASAILSLVGLKVSSPTRLGRDNRVASAILSLVGLKENNLPAVSEKFGLHQQFYLWLDWKWFELLAFFSSQVASAILSLVGLKGDKKIAMMNGRGRLHQQFYLWLDWKFNGWRSVLVAFCCISNFIFGWIERIFSAVRSKWLSGCISNFTFDWIEQIFYHFGFDGGSVVGFGDRAKVPIDFSKYEPRRSSCFKPLCCEKCGLVWLSFADSLAFWPWQLLALMLLLI